MSKTAEHRKYMRQEHAKHCLQQMVFAKEGEDVQVKENDFRYATLAEKGLDPSLKVTCPFCLGLNQLRLFLISTKKGYDRGKGKCPLCGQIMHLRTLVKVMTSPEQYAAFAQPYAKMGFWKKVSFDVWKRRLKMMGWTERFWNEYRRLRGDVEEEEQEKELEQKWREYEEAVEQ